MSATTTVFYVASEAELNADISAINQGGTDSAVNTAYAIYLTGDLALSSNITAISLAAGDTLSIVGQYGGVGNATVAVDGGGTYRGFTINSGNVVLQSLGIQNTFAMGGAGGNGALAGGGGAGLGGAVFVGAGAQVTLVNTYLSGNGAYGGSGGYVTGSGTGAGGAGTNGLGNGGAGGHAGGFGGGGGSGAAGGFGAGSNAGGGLAAGGDIFVQQGGQLTLQNATLGAGQLNAGNGAKALGTAVFSQGNNTLQITGGTISGSIADQTGSGGSGATAGIVSLSGSGTLAATNTYSGGTTVFGTLDLTAAGAAGSGAIILAAGQPDVLAFTAAAAPANVIKGFIPGLNGDAFDITGVGTATAATMKPGNTLQITGATPSPITLHLDPTVSYAADTFVPFTDNAGGTLVKAVKTSFAVATEADLNAAIRQIDIGGNMAVAGLHYSITFSGSITLGSDIWALNMLVGDSLTINGGGNALNGAGAWRGFFVYSANVTIQNLTIQDTVATGGAGGSGLVGGGGGAGLGGGLFIAQAGTVTLSNVHFVSDSAIGGAGGNGGGIGWGGGGGLGGAGGAGSTTHEGGGGGVGVAASGGTGSIPNGGAGIVLGAGAGEIGAGTFSGTNIGAGGAYGGGGGVGAFFSGGGGRGGGRSTPGEGGAGGITSAGSFGGGAGSGRAAGFGGGGAAWAGGPNGTPDKTSGLGGWGGGGSGGLAGGFGAGAGGSGGGGGLGAGGDIFVQQGGSLIIQGGSLGAGTVAGGIAGTGASTGQGLGSGLFIQGGDTITLTQAAGQSTVIGGTIVDDGTNGGGALIANGPGTLTLGATNSFIGGLLLNAGTLALGAQGAAGSGAITFGYGSTAELIIGTGETLANIVAGFLPGDTIDLRGVGLEATPTLSVSNVLTLTGGTKPVTLHLDPNQIFTNETFVLKTDGAGGTLLTAGTPGNDHAPHITWAASVVGNDHTALHPLAALKVADLDIAQAETATVTLSALGNGLLSNFGTGSFNAASGVYSVIGSAAAVTTALDGLVFTPKDHEVAPGQTVQTGFAVSVTDATLAAKAATTLTVTALNDPPVITGTTSGIVDAYWTEPFKPFPTVTITDPDFAATETVTIGISLPGTLTLTTPGSTLTSTAAGYVLSAGSPAAVTAALRGLQFTPAEPANPSLGFTITYLTLSVSDGIAPAVISPWTEVAAGLPIFTNTNAHETVADNATIQPFAGVGVTDSPGLAIQSLSISTIDPVTDQPLVGSYGVLSGAGLTNLGGGNYSLLVNPGDSFATLTARLDALVFTPVAVAAPVAIGFALTGFDGATTASNYNTALTIEPVAPYVGAGAALRIVEATNTALTVANFTDANHTEAASAFTALINWGDGTTSAGTITGSGGTFHVVASTGHAYADEGSYTVTTTLTHTANAAMLAMAGSATVIEGDKLAVGAAAPVSAASGVAFSGTVAHFTDTNTVNTAGDFAATIAWGDGVTSAGTVTDVNGQISVAGSHTYLYAANDTVSVTLADTHGTAKATATNSATVSGTTWLLTTHADLVTGSAANDTIIAPANTLSTGDQIGGGGGTNTLLLSGGGQFNLATPTTQTNIQIVSAQEGASTAEQVVHLRAGTGLTVNVAPDPLANPASGIVIYGAANSDHINLGKGHDTVVLGSGETVTSGGGSNNLDLTTSTTGVTVNGGTTGTNALYLSGGGSYVMAPGLTGITWLFLQQTTALTANAGATLAIKGSSSGGDTIVLGAATQHVFGGGANETIRATAANAGALVNGLGANSTLEVTTGGAAHLNASTSVTTVKLDAATNLSLSRMSFITAIGSAGADTITAAATNQTLTGSGGGDTLIGYSGGTDTFSDTSKGLNGAIINGFVTSDNIAISDLSSTTASLLATASGTNTIVSIKDGLSHAAQFTMAGAWSQAGFHLAAYGTTGTLITHS